MLFSLVLLVPLQLFRISHLKLDFFFLRSFPSRFSCPCIFANFTFFQIFSYRNLLTPTLRASFFSTHLFYISSTRVSMKHCYHITHYFSCPKDLGKKLLWSCQGICDYFSPHRTMNMPQRRLGVITRNSIPRALWSSLYFNF